MESKTKLYPNSLITVYNCNNCGYFNDCDIEREDIENTCDYRRYWCFAHSHFDEKNAK